MSQNRTFESLFPQLRRSMADSEQLMELEILFDSENAAFINSEDLYSQLNGIWEI